jgi:AsmA protein
LRFEISSLGVAVKRWAKILLVVVAVVIAVAAAVPLFVDANTFRPAIERQLTRTLGRAVKLGDLRLSVFSRSLVAEELSVADDPNFSAAPFLTAKEVRIGVSLRPLIFSHEVVLRDFEIESPQIAVIRDWGGAWNFSSVGHRTATGAPVSAGVAEGAASAASKGSAAPFPDFVVDLIAVEDGRVTFSTVPGRGRAIVYDHVNVTARDFAFALRFPFDFSADLPAGGSIKVSGHLGPINGSDAAATPADAQITVKSLDPVGAGFIDPEDGLSLLADLNVHTAFDGQTSTTNGTVHIENLKLRKGAAAAPKPLDLAYSGTHRVREYSGQIDDATIKVGDAEIHVSGTYHAMAPSPSGGPSAANAKGATGPSGAVSSEVPVLNLKLSGQNLPIDELQSLMTAAAVRLPNGSKLKGGKLSLNLAVTGPAKSLVITGPIAVDNTRLVGFDISDKIHGIASLSGVKTGDTSEIEKLRVNVRVTNSGIMANDIYAVIPAMGELNGSGTISAANQLDFDLVAKVSSASGLGKVGVSLFSALNGGSGKKSGVPLRITGTPDEPYITADVGGVFQKTTNPITSLFGKKK